MPDCLPPGYIHKTPKTWKVDAMCIRTNPQGAIPAACNSIAGLGYRSDEKIIKVVDALIPSPESSDLSR